MGVLSSAVAFFVMHYALAHLAATQVAVAANLIPVITLLAEVFLIGMDITLLKVLGVAVRKQAKITSIFRAGVV